MTYDAKYQRTERLKAMKKWSEVGVLEPRVKLPIERDFEERVGNKTRSFFRPEPLIDLDSREYHRAVGYLIDAFDSLPWRVDIAFDSTWKALELATNAVIHGNITDRLKVVASDLDSRVVDKLCANVPMQSCEYLFKRLVSDPVGGKGDQRLENRIDGLNDSQIKFLIESMRSKFEIDSGVSRRNGASLVRRVLRGETLKIGATSDFRLNEASRARVLLSLFLYTARNERFHGASFSPFISSKASMKTYTHPYFAFLASYYLLLDVWRKTLPQVLSNDHEGVLASLDTNLHLAQEIFGRHWEV